MHSQGNTELLFDYAQIWSVNKCCEKGGQGSKTLETQLSLFTKLKRSKQRKSE